MSYQSEVLADNPVGYWRFEETSGSVVADEIDDNDGTVFGADLDVATGEAALGSAVEFDGVDDRIIVDNDAAHSGWSDFTIEFWIISTENRDNNYLVSVWQISGNERAWRIFPNGANILLGLSNTGGGSDSYTVMSRSAVYDGQLHHVVVNRSGTAVRGWIDGIEQASASHSGTVHSSLGVMGIGARGDNSNHHSGILDELAVYNFALSEARIQAHYDAAFASEDPANLAATVDGDTVSLSWDASPLVSA